MNARDLAVVTLIALTCGALAGVVAPALVGDPQDARDGAHDELATTVAGLARDLDASRVELRSSERARQHLEERLTRAELRIAGLLEQREHAADGSAVAPDGGGGGTDATAAGPAAIHRRLDALSFESAAAIAGLKADLTSVSAATGHLEKFRFAAKFRALSEEERWPYLQEDLRLTDPQMHEIREAVAEHQQALKDARSDATAAGTVVLGTGETRMTFSTLDPEKMAAANTRFRERVDNVLLDEQKTSWDERGYDHALGVGRRSMVVRRAGVDSVIGVSVEIPRDAGTTSGE